MPLNYMILMDSLMNLTLEYASDNGYEVDEEGFQAEMKAQKRTCSCSS